jgi:putative ABC transport system permease protein
MITRKAMFTRMVTRSLTRRRSRVIIAVLAVAIGATTLFALVTIAVDVPKQMSREMRGYGANLLIMPAAGASDLSASVAVQVEEITAGQDVIAWAPYRYHNVLANSQPYLVAGTDLAAAREVSPYWYVDGAWPARAGEVMIGQDIASWLDLEAGQTIELQTSEAPSAEVKEDGAEGGHAHNHGAGGDGADGEVADGAAAEPADDVYATFAISGVVSTGGSEDSLIVMDLADLEEFTGVDGKLDAIEYSVAASAGEIDRLAREISATVSGAEATGVKRLTEADTSVLATLRSLLGLVTAIVLALTMIGVSTTMMAVVAERRNEIALRKALGGTPRQIGREFLVEGLALGAVGGLLGTGLGYALARAVSWNVFHRGVHFDWVLALLTVVGSTLVAWAACLIPVRRTQEIDPAVVLAGE